MKLNRNQTKTGVFGWWLETEPWLPNALLDLLGPSSWPKNNSVASALQTLKRGMQSLFLHAFTNLQVNYFFGIQFGHALATYQNHQAHDMKWGLVCSNKKTTDEPMIKWCYWFFGVVLDLRAQNLLWAPQPGIWKMSDLWILLSTCSIQVYVQTTHFFMIIMNLHLN